MMLIQQQEKLGSCGRRSGIHNDGTTNGTVLVRSGKWLDPNEALPQKGARGDVLSEAQVIEWREHGFALVDGVFPPALLAQARDDALAVFPSAGSDGADAVNDFGSSGNMEFPAASAAVNDLTLHPRLLRAVAQLLAIETLELRLRNPTSGPSTGARGSRVARATTPTSGCM